jgi:hypothetical protein
MKIYLSTILILIFAFGIYAQTGLVTTPSAQIRIQPSNKSKIVSTVKKGAKFNLLSNKNQSGWYQVAFIGSKLKGWIHGNNIKIIDELPDLSDSAVKPNSIEEQIKYLDDLAEYLKELDKELNKETDKNTNEWIYVITSKYTKIYFNPSKTVRSGDFVEFWAKEFAIDKKTYWDFKWKPLGIDPPNNFSPAKYLFSLVRYKTNCKSRTFRPMQEITYWEGGSTGGIDSSDKVLPMAAVIPDSLGEVLFKKACAVK